ncbi:MAG: hypothetical protein WBC04_14690 [Candidatus Acidiferrales bacterium]
MKRREFMQLAIANAAWFGISCNLGEAFASGPFLTPVTVRAELGNYFPPLELVRHVRQSEGTKALFLMVAQPRGPYSQGHNHHEQAIDVAFRLSEVSRNENEGNLSREVRELLEHQIESFLEKEFHYRSVRTTLSSSPSFWYPYLRRASGNVVFCRLVVSRAPLEESV